MDKTICINLTNVLSATYNIIAGLPRAFRTILIDYGQPLFVSLSRD